MVDAHNPDRARAIEGAITEVRTLNADGAVAIRNVGLEVVTEMGLAVGFLAVYGSTGVELATQAVGMPKPSNVELARAKIQTVLATRRSTRLQREYMEREGLDRDDYAHQLGSLFGGGVAVFADPDKKVFVGAVAFSGGKQEQDEEIGRRAVETTGLYTDIPPAVLQEPQRQ